VIIDVYPIVVTSRDVKNILQTVDYLLKRFVKEETSSTKYMLFRGFIRFLASSGNSRFL
jgi:hypothetical protein